MLVVDEAGMVGTRHLHRLLTHARRANAKVVLVGDNRQLPEINAGGIFSLLASRPTAVHLVENRRQRHRIDRDALAALRHGNVAAALSRWRRKGRIVEGETADATRQALVADWHAAVTAGRDGIIVANRRSDVADLNHRARQTLVAAGALGESRVVGGLAVATGETLVALRNDYGIGVFNGTRLTVTDIGTSEIHARTAEGRQVALPQRYIEDGHVDYGYATTIHKAQGLTCDDVFVHGDDTLYREAGYTAMSRGRHTAHLYVIRPNFDGGAHLAAAPSYSVERALNGSCAQTTAHALRPSTGASVDMV